MTEPMTDPMTETEPLTSRIRAMCIGNPTDHMGKKSVKYLRLLCGLFFLVVVILELTNTSNVDVTIPISYLLIILSFIFLVGAAFFSRTRDLKNNFLEKPKGKAKFNHNSEDKAAITTESCGLNANTKSTISDCTKAGSKNAFIVSRLYLRDTYSMMALMSILAVTLIFIKGERYKNAKVTLPLSAVGLMSFFISNTLVMLTQALTSTAGSKKPSD